MQKCSKCGTENPDSAKFCINCGYDLSTAFCPVCGEPIHKWERKCKMCNSEWDDKWNVTKNRPPKHPELEKTGGTFFAFLIMFVIVAYIFLLIVGIIQSLLS